MPTVCTFCVHGVYEIGAVASAGRFMRCHKPAHPRPLVMPKGPFDDRDMYLVHAHLGPGDAALLPPDAARVFASSAHPAEQVEHVVVHRDHASGPVIGLFMATPNLAEAERNALEVCRRAVSEHTALRGVSIVSCGAVLVPAPWDQERTHPPDPPSGPRGRLMPLHNPSSTNPFHPF